MLSTEMVQTGSPCSASSAGVLGALEMQCIRHKLKEDSKNGWRQDVHALSILQMGWLHLKCSVSEVN